MEKKGLLYEGKAKRLFATKDELLLIQEFKDDLVIDHGKRKTKFKGKGNINCEFSAFMFEYLENYHIPTHFQKKFKKNSMIVKRVEMIPIEVAVRNFAAGAMLRRYNLEDGQKLEYPVIEHLLKDDSLSDPLVNDYHCFAFGLATPDEMRAINRLASKVNAILRSFFQRRGLVLIDLKMEFGKRESQIMLADEISPDVMRIRDAKSGKKFGGDRFRYEMGGVAESYEELAERTLK
ncbi:MAG: phosphoribosylaminoimidazolesuccinocarboxamide synthase [Candidatus Delongbacteria bacterium]|nr:phosphoribosylaminoimidazolesuccinocarboxamide synthase [Candidatus Delongbacteria bacterium]